MALLGNYSVLMKLPIRFMAGSTTSVEPQLRSNYNKHGLNRNWQLRDRDAANEIIAIPEGYYPPYTWVIPNTRGALSSFANVAGTGSVLSSNLAGGLNAVSTLTGLGLLSSAAGTMLMYGNATAAGVGAFSADITGLVEAGVTLAGVGDITGELSSIAAILATLAGSGDISGDMQAVLAALATLAGTSATTADITGVVEAVAEMSGSASFAATIKAVWEMQATLAGTGALETAIEAFAHMVCELNGTSTLSATPYAIGDMSASISTASGELTTAGIASAVWNSLATDFNAALTMGNKVNSAASAGDPWTTALPGSYGAGTAGAIVGEIHTELQTAVELIQVLIKHKENRTRVDDVAKTLTVYDDDGVTPLVVFDLKNFAGVASVTEIAERVPR